MDKGRRKRLRELSAIYLTAALLVVSLGRLWTVKAGTDAVAASATAGEAVLTEGGTPPDDGMPPEDGMPLDDGTPLEDGGEEAFPQLYAQEPGEYRAPEGKTVFFTFDDGPSHNTAALLDILREEEVPATFFVTGQNAEEAYAGELLRRILEEGHSMGLHTFTHDFSQIYASPNAYLADLDRLREYVLEETGYQPDIIRFPGGSATVNAPDWVMDPLMREINRRGFAYYDWNVVSGDDTATAYPADYLARQILEGSQGKDVVVVLCHDNATPTTTPEAVRTAIAAFREQGYSFDKLTRDVEPIQLKKPALTT